MISNLLPHFLYDIVLFVICLYFPAFCCCLVKLDHPPFNLYLLLWLWISLWTKNSCSIYISVLSCQISPLDSTLLVATNIYLLAASTNTFPQPHCCRFLMFYFGIDFFILNSPAFFAHIAFQMFCGTRNMMRNVPTSLFQVHLRPEKGGLPHWCKKYVAGQETTPNLYV